MYNYQAKVVRWVDGDTVWLTIDLGFHMTTTQMFRLNGVDTPERGQLGHKEAMTRANQLAPINTWVEVTTYKADKYGRWLVDIWIKGGHGGLPLSHQLITEGLAKEYHGGTKA